MSPAAPDPHRYSHRHLHLLRLLLLLVRTTLYTLSCMSRCYIVGWYRVSTERVWFMKYEEDLNLHDWLMIHDCTTHRNFSSSEMVGIEFIGNTCLIDMFRSSSANKDFSGKSLFPFSYIGSIPVATAAQPWLVPVVVVIVCVLVISCVFIVIIVGIIIMRRRQSGNFIMSPADVTSCSLLILHLLI